MGKPEKGVSPTSGDGTPNALAVNRRAVSRYLQATAGGNYRTVSAAYAGVSVMTTRRWMQYAERETINWNTAHPDQPLETILQNHLTEHSVYGTGDDGTRIQYAEAAPALAAPPPIAIAPGYWLCIVLSELVEKAEAEAEVQAVARVQAASRNPNHWQAAMTFLERRHPDRWRRKDATEVSGPGGSPIQVTSVSADQLLARVISLAEQRAEQGDGLLELES